jgi:hypothetical protein
LPSTQSGAVGDKSVDSMHFELSEQAIVSAEAKS